MFDTALFPITWRVTRRRLLASPLAIAAGLAFPAFVVWIGFNDSYETAAKFFFFLLPHVFLIAAQDTVRTDIESGALENVLFLGGRFRGFLRAKSYVLAAAVGIYACGLFGLFTAWGLAAGAFRPYFVIRFALGLLAGSYYIALAGTLSYFLRAGSNVLALLLAQSAALIALLFSATSRTGFLDYAASGRFPGLGPKLLFGGLVAILPNVVVSGRLLVFAAEVLTGLALSLFVQNRLARALELGK
ncbi:MAG: hypothetical protein A2V76_10375 [Candidatus Aminicenantes bacterium RBG_16_63_14]|nr:MAG: hypothetical protein A2V76_10375 [Candidatus Aminicenantes bacterium RBG_16_63_14]